MMEFIKQPMAIEHRSMELIAPYLAGLSLSEAEKKVYSRIIHAAGDVEYAPIIRISETAVAAGIAALRGGADIYTDVEMVRTGINKRKLASFGGTVHCRIADPEIAARAKTQGVTRSLMAMRSFGAAHVSAYLAAMENGVRPACIVGIPVGFVGAADSKKELAENGLVPYITVEGTKGGSPIAAAAVNAMLYEIDDSRD